MVSPTMPKAVIASSNAHTMPSSQLSDSDLVRSGARLREGMSSSMTRWRVTSVEPLGATCMTAASWPGSVRTM